MFPQSRLDLSAPRRLFSLLTVSALLLGLILAASTASPSSSANVTATSTPEGPPAAAKVNKSKRSGFTLTYDAAMWKRVKATETDYVAGEKDRVTFTNGTSRFSLIGTTEYAEGEMAACRNDYVAKFFSHPEVAQGLIVEIEREKDDRASVGYLYFLQPEGMLAMKVRYTECRWLGDDLTVVIIYTYPSMSGVKELDARTQVLDGLRPPAPAATPESDG